MNTATEPAEETPTIISQILPLINEFLPKLLGGGVKADAVREVVRMTPQFQKIIGDRAELIRIIGYLDKTKGPDETDRILGALKVRRPMYDQGQPGATQPAGARVPRREVPSKRATRGK